MILLFIDSEDVNTNTIINWLIKFKAKIEIVDVNSNDNIDLISIKEGKIFLEINGKVVNYKKIKSIYFSRSYIKMKTPTIKINKSYLNNLEKNNLIHFLDRNIEARKEIINYLLLKKARVFGTPEVGRINKINVLNEAKKLNFATPKWILTTNKQALESFYEQHKSIVLKSYNLGYTNVNYKNNTWQTTYTNKLNLSDLKKIPTSFPLTLFQEHIQKDFEVRTFVFNKTFYSVAIFSQNNNKTKIDYRRYDEVKPNREIPFEIDNGIKKKIIKLFETLNLNTGSIDFIISNNKYYFLEVNPVGQYENVSCAGNYYIEKKIAEYLLKHEE